MMFLELEDGLVELTSAGFEVRTVPGLAVPPAYEIAVVLPTDALWFVAGPHSKCTCHAILRRIRTAMERVNPPMVIRRAEYMPDDEAAP